MKYLNALGGRFSGARLLEGPNNVRFSSLGVNGLFVFRDRSEVRASLMIFELVGKFEGAS